MEKELKDPFRGNEPGNSSEVEIKYRRELDSFFSQSIGTNVEKLHNFTKYVPRIALTRFLAKYELFKKVLSVQGSIIECGVYLGGGLMSFAQCSAILEPVNYQRKIIGFDTFSGFTEACEREKVSSANLASEAFSLDAYEDLQKSIKLFDSNRFINHIPKVSLVRGDVRKTVPLFLAENPQTVISLLYLDLTLLEPTKFALEQLINRIPKGGIIAFNAVNNEKWPGETLAVLETVGLKNLRLQRFPFEPFICYAVME